MKRFAMACIFLAVLAVPSPVRATSKESDILRRSPETLPTRPKVHWTRWFWFVPDINEYLATVGRAVR